MKYFLPDSQDLVDPSFDFERERRSIDRLRQRDDSYAHEIFAVPAYDGILVSKGIVDGFGGASGRYSIAQRQRLLRTGAREFFRTEAVEHGWGRLPIMGDCGAFTYVQEKTPPYSVDDVISFYLACRFDFGISVDHVILDYQPAWDDPGGGTTAPAEIRERQEVTLTLARSFLERQQVDRLPFDPLGVAQGWSPRSYAHAVAELQKMGYRYIALGGMVPLKTQEILASLRSIAAVRRPETRLHLLGVTRTENLPTFVALGVASFDSTSPLRRAFKDDKDNYYAPDRAYTAIRVPQVEGNAKLKRAIASGRVSQEEARRRELACLTAMRRFDLGDVVVAQVIEALKAYEDLYDPAHRDRHIEAYRATLSDRPWKSCPCEVCRTLGHHVILFRGAERNRRRGFHNTWAFYRTLQRDIAKHIVAPSNGAESDGASVQAKPGSSAHKSIEARTA